MKTIHVNVSKPYDVLTGTGILDEIHELIKPICRSNRVAIITDDIVSGLYLDHVRECLNNAGFDTCFFVFPNGENSKNINTLSDILEFLAQSHIRRNDTLIALGGGVTGDIAGLAAALFMRGISVVQIPTTLLAAADSSVGGKTAIDLKNGKNLAGVFWQPSMVICDINIIRDLPSDIFAEGMAEVIKCNIIRSLPIISYIEEGTLEEHLAEVVDKCVTLKRDIVEKDEFDSKGIRNILNVGHTVAHAIEKLSGYSISHGHAVGTGMVLEAGLAEKMSLCTPETVERIRKAVCRYHLMIHIPWNAKELADAMMSDKKNRDSQIVFELPQSLGDCIEIKLDRDKVAELMNLP